MHSFGHGKHKKKFIVEWRVIKSQFKKEFCIHQNYYCIIKHSIIQDVFKKFENPINNLQINNKDYFLYHIVEKISLYSDCQINKIYFVIIQCFNLCLC